MNPFISSTDDSLRRLKPGYEAPVCIVASLGNNTNEPSRNRSVLIGLVKENDNLLSLLSSGLVTEKRYLGIELSIDCFLLFSLKQ